MSRQLVANNTFKKYIPIYEKHQYCKEDGEDPYMKRTEYYENVH